jgi:hypothetical protein
MVGRNARILKHSAGAAFRPSERFAVGLTLEWIYVQRLEYQLVIDAIQFPGEVNPVQSELDMLATVSGSDVFTPQAIVGVWYRPVAFLELGASAQVIPTRIHTKSTLSIDALSPQIDDQVALRRDGQPANDLRLSLPLPLTARLGARYRHLDGAREVFDVELDVTYESWSRVERFHLEGNGLLATLLAQTVDVGTIEVDKQWRDTFSVQLGGEWSLPGDAVTIRGGLFYDTAVAPRSHAHVDFVSGAQLGGALGASLSLGAVELSLAHEYRHQPLRRVREGEARVLQETPASQCGAPFTDPDACHPQYLGRGAPPVNAGAYRAASHATSFDVTYRF